MHALPQQLYFGVTEIGELADFGQHGGAGAAALRPARKRNDAVRALFVAALDNREIGAPGIVAPGDFGLKCLVRVRIQPGHPAVPRLQLRQKFGQLAVARRATDQADPRRALEDLLAFLLRYASEDADDAS